MNLEINLPSRRILINLNLVKKTGVIASIPAEVEGGLASRSADSEPSAASRLSISAEPTPPISPASCNQALKISVDVGK